MKKILVILLIMAVALTAASCHITINNTSSGEKEPEEKKEEEETVDPEKIKEDLLEAVVPPEDFDPAGEYQDEKNESLIMEITPDGDDTYQVEIIMAGSSDQTTVWSFEGGFDRESGLLTYKKCIKSIITVDEDGQNEEVVYRRGTGALGYYDDGFHWQDDKENIGQGVYFIKTGDLDNVAIEDE